MPSIPYLCGRPSSGPKWMAVSGRGADAERELVLPAPERMPSDKADLGDFPKLLLLIGNILGYIKVFYISRPNRTRLLSLLPSAQPRGREGIARSATQAFASQISL